MSGSKSNGSIKNTHVVKIDDPNVEAPCRFISQVKFSQKPPLHTRKLDWVPLSINSHLIRPFLIDFFSKENV